MVAVPAARAATRPLALTVAISVSELDQASCEAEIVLPRRSVALALSCRLEPAATLVSVGVTVTEVPAQTRRAATFATGSVTFVLSEQAAEERVRTAMAVANTVRCVRMLEHSSFFGSRPAARLAWLPHI